MTIAIKGLCLDVIGAIDDRLGCNWRLGALGERDDGNYDVELFDCEFSIVGMLVILETHDELDTYVVTLFNTEYVEIVIT